MIQQIEAWRREHKWSARRITDELTDLAIVINRRSPHTALAGQDIADGLARLLDQWGEHLWQLRPTGGTVFMPFDFSDQCTAWLRVSSPSGNRATIQAGWSSIEGWSFYPSDFAEAAARVHDFEPVVNASVECNLDDLIAAVAQNRDSLAAPRE